MEDLSKYKDTFLSEAKERIASMNKSLLEFEKQPAGMEFVNSIFREAHTLKGMAATMDYAHTARLCHAVEDVLDALRKKQLTPAKCIDILFESFDTLELSLKEIGKERGEPDTAVLVERLQALSTGAQKSAIEDQQSAIEDRQSAIENIQSIEVKVERLNLLMNLAEELLINKMRLERIKEELQNPELTACVDALGRLVTDIQYNIMAARMVPIGFVFNRFPRMVRDIAKQQKKEIDLKMEGADIELDRGVIDEIGESLLHLIRNATDHGLETPDVRKKAGKPPQGTISLTAKRIKGFAVIEVSDDGRGLDIPQIKDRAVRSGLISETATEKEVVNSIFSGVSTTKRVTEVSGRGFGLNIVKEKIDSIGGSIEVESRSAAEPVRNGASNGAGMTFTIEIPLTLAIIKALFVKAAGRPYAIPLVNVERLATISKEEIKGMLDFEAIVLNGEDIPIIRLDVLFKESREEKVESRENRASSIETQPIVIINRGEEELGLAVDSFMSTQEIVIKPLNKLVKENRYFSGSTIIGTGEVVLILDVANLMLTKRSRK